MVESSRITSTEVFDAIEKLLAAGQAPTHMSVREVLGSRGSGPVLSKFIARWFEEHGAEFLARSMTLAHANRSQISVPRYGSLQSRHHRYSLMPSGSVRKHWSLARMLQRNAR